MKKHRLSITISLCLLLIIIGAVCYANIYERLSDSNPCLSQYGINEGYGAKGRTVNTIHIVSQNVRVRENKIYYDLGFDGEVSLENAVMRFTFHYTLPNGMDKTSSATLTSSSQDEDYVCHFEFTGNTTIQYNITLQLDQSTIVATAENTVIDWSNLITRFEGDTVAYPTLTFTYLDLNYQTETYTVTDSAASITVPMIHSYAQLNVSVDYPDAVITSIDNNANARWSGLDRPSDSLESGHINTMSRPIVTSGYPSVCNLSFTPVGISADKTLMPISVEIDFDAVVIGGFTATNSQIIYNHDWYTMTLTPTITHSPSDIGSYTLVLNESDFDYIFEDFSIEELTRNLYLYPSQDPLGWYDNQISSYTHNTVGNTIVLKYFFDISPEREWDSSPIDVTHVYTDGIAGYNTIRGSIYTGVVSDSGKNYPIVAEYGYDVSYWFNMIPVVNRVNIVSERAYLEKSGMASYLFVELAFDKPVSLPQGSVEFNLSGFHEPISNGLKRFTVITHNGNYVKLRHNQFFTNVFMGLIADGVVNYNDGEYIVGDNNYVINWGDDYLTRNIFDNSRIYQQGE